MQLDAAVAALQANFKDSIAGLVSEVEALKHALRDAGATSSVGAVSADASSRR